MKLGVCGQSGRRGRARVGGNGECVYKCGWDVEWWVGVWVVGGGLVGWG